MSYFFSKQDELLALCKAHDAPISEIMIRRELELGNMTRDEIMAEMRLNIDTMRESIRVGLTEDQRTISGLMGGDAELLELYAAKSHMGERMARIVAASMAVLEVNASMGKIVAAPTAGASGILPGVLIVCAEYNNWDDETIEKGLFCAGAIGMMIMENASMSGAEGGCQAETGSGAAMAAAALTELSGGSPAMALHAAAISLKNVMGLVCDPVAGLVECPCIKRNAIGAANAVMSADMALAGIKSIIPFDEVVLTMKSVGRQIVPDLRETAKGGLAATPTARRITRELGLGRDAFDD